MIVNRIYGGRLFPSSSCRDLGSEYRIFIVTLIHCGVFYRLCRAPSPRKTGVVSELHGAEGVAVSAALQLPRVPGATNVQQTLKGDTFGQSSNGKTPEARVAFKSPSGVSRTSKSADLAKDLGVEVKEIDTDVKGQKVLNFKGIGHGPANQNKAAVESNTRDVFKASHERQNEISEDAHKMDATAHSAQNKYADSSHSAAAAAGFPLKPQARCERLSEDRYRDTGDMIEKAAKQPAHPSRPDDEEHCVSRYQAMKATAASALNRASGIYTSNQDSANEYGRAATQKVESAYRKGIDALDQGLQAMKDMASTAKATDEYTGPNSKEFPHTVPANNSEGEERPMRPESCSSNDSEGAWSTGGSTFRVHPRGRGATEQTSSGGGSTQRGARFDQLLAAMDAACSV